MGPACRDVTHGKGIFGKGRIKLIFAAVKAECFFPYLILFLPALILQEQAETGGSGGLQDTPSSEDFAYIFPDQ